MMMLYLFKKSTVFSVPLKSNDPLGLGFDIKGNMTKGIYISKLSNRGPAKESGKIQLGDKILSFKVSFENIVYEDALTIISYASTHPCEITLLREETDQKRENLEEEANEDGEDADSRFIKTPFNPLFRSQSMDNLHQIGKSKAPTYSEVTVGRVQSEKEIRKEDETDTINIPDLNLNSTQMLSEVTSNYEKNNVNGESVLIEKEVRVESVVLSEASVIVHNVNEIDDDKDSKTKDKSLTEEDRKSVGSSSSEHKITIEEEPVIQTVVENHRIDIEEELNSSVDNNTEDDKRDVSTLYEIMAKTLAETPEAIIIEQKNDNIDEAKLAAEAEITAKRIEEEAIEEVVKLKENNVKVEFEHLSDSDKLDIIRASYEPEDAKRMSALSPNPKSSTTVVMVDENRRSRSLSSSSSSSEEQRLSSTITPRQINDDVIVTDEKADILLRRRSAEKVVAVKALAVETANIPSTDSDSIKEGEPIDEMSSPTITPLSYKRYSAELDSHKTVIKDTNDNVTLQSPRSAQVSSGGGVAYYVGLDPPQPPPGLLSIDDENESTSSLLKDLGLDKYVKNTKNDSEA